MSLRIKGEVCDQSSRGEEEEWSGRASWKRCGKLG